MKIHTLSGYIQSIYLVEYKDKLLLLDGCSRADTEYVCSFIRDELKRPLSDLKLIVVTHMHPDHAGGAHTLRKLTGAKIVTSKHEHHWYRGVDGWLMYFTDLCLARWVAKRKKKKPIMLYYSPWLKPDIRLRDEELLPGFEEWQILETPGHTDRDLSLLHIPSNRIYVADLMVTVKGKYVPPFPIFYLNNYRRSLEKVLSYEPESLWLAHSGEVQLNDEDLDYLMQSIPRRPTTHWRATKHKTRQIIKLIRTK
ncbi:MBL fold metallo-hydrolase [Vibrio sp. HN007]|uniref:MBL fold metallo-hydrolase n=1 Tax=Vibrio iocasae TaxID=3098914 RepID=UPI0035D40173